MAAIRRCDVVATRDNITLLPSENDREVRMKRWLDILALALAVASSATIVARSVYRHQAYRPDDQSKVSEPLFDLYFVEADDEGWFWQPDLRWPRRRLDNL
jgi:hypothetical protein